MVPCTLGPFTDLLNRSWTRRGQGCSQGMAECTRAELTGAASSWSKDKTDPQASTGELALPSPRAKTEQQLPAMASPLCSPPPAPVYHPNVPELPSAREGQGHSRLRHTCVATPSRNPLRSPGVNPRNVSRSSFKFGEGGCVIPLK